MHSSRMRTVRCSSRLLGVGVSARGRCLPDTTPPPPVDRMTDYVADGQNEIKNFFTPRPSWADSAGIVKNKKQNSIYSQVNNSYNLSEMSAQECHMTVDRSYPWMYIVTQVMQYRYEINISKQPISLP